MNTYGYVGGNPLYWTDPYGLQAITLPVPVNPATTSNPVGWVVLAGVSGLSVGTSIYNNFDEQILDAIGWVLNENADDNNDDVTPEQCDDDIACQKGDRFKSGNDPLQQLDEIEKAQRKVRQGKSNQIIDSIEKSRQRARNRLRPHNIDLDNLDDDFN